MIQRNDIEAPDERDQVEALPPDEMHPGRRLVLRGVVALPAIVTLLNALAGLGAIHFATKDAIGAAVVGNLRIAAWLIFAAMVADMLDGRIARMTRHTSDFGGQLDSLADLISFGVAPGVLMMRTVAAVVRGNFDRIAALARFTTVERLAWVIAAAFALCAAMRLARFNVENVEEEEGHMEFTGLPSPGAAAAVAALVLLFVHLVPFEQGWRASTWALVVVTVTLPVLTLGAALLMVSRFRYPHLVNRYLLGHHSFNYLVGLMAVVLVVIGTLLVEPFVTAAVLTTAFALWGPVRTIRRRPSD